MYLHVDHESDSNNDELYIVLKSRRKSLDCVNALLIYGYIKKAAYVFSPSPLSASSPSLTFWMI